LRRSSTKLQCIGNGFAVHDATSGDDRDLAGGDQLFYKGKCFQPFVFILAFRYKDTAMSTGFQDVLTGKKTAQQVADALQKAWQTAKAKGETLKPV